MKDVNIKKERHLRPHRFNPRSNFLQACMGNFVSPTCIYLQKIRQRRVLFSIITNFTYMVMMLQLLAASTFPMGQDLYKLNGFVKKATIISAFFTRITPPFCTYMVTLRISYMIFVIIVFSSLGILWTFLTFHPTSLFSPEKPIFQPFYAVTLLKLLFAPAISLTVYFYFNSDGFIIPIIGTVCCFATIVGNYLYEWHIYGVPNLSNNLGVCWMFNRFAVNTVLHVLIFVIAETMPYIDDQWEQFLAVGINIVFYLYFTLWNALCLPGVSLFHNSVTLFFYIYSIVIAIVYLFGVLLLTHPGITTIIMLILAFPVYLIANALVSYRSKEMIKFVIYALDTNNYMLLDNLSLERLISCIGNSIYEVGYREELFNYAHQRFPDNFEILSLQAKIAIIKLHDWEKLDSFIKKILSLKSLKFLEQVTAVFYEILSFQQETTRNSEQLNEMCTLATDEYLQILNMFWSEVLLGRPGRVHSLAAAVYKRYQTALSLFSVIGSGGRENKNYRRFCAASTLKLSEPHFEPVNSILNSVFDKYEIAREPVIRKGTDDEDEYQPPLRSVHIFAHLNHYQNKISLIRFFIIFFPIVTIVVLILVSLLFAGRYSSFIKPTWELYYQFERIGLEVANVYMLFPYLFLNIDNPLDKTWVTDVIIDDYLYPSKMTNPLSDFQKSINKIRDMTPIFLSKLGTYNHQELTVALSNSKYIAYIGSTKGEIQIRNLTFTQYIHYIPIYFTEIANAVRNDPSEIISIFNSTEITYIYNDIDILLKIINEFTEEFPKHIKKKIISECNALIDTYCVAYGCTAILIFIIDIILIIIMGRNVKKIFEPLFSLPKVAISELIEKLENKPKIADNEVEQSNETQIDSQIQFNLMQLSCDQPPQLYPTITKSKLCISIILFVTLVIIATMFIPMSTKLLNDTKLLLNGLIEAQYASLLPIRLMRISSSLFEFIGRLKNDLHAPQNRTIALVNSLLNETKTLENMLAPLATSVMKFTKIIQPELFLGLTCENSSHPFKCLSNIDRLSNVYIQGYIILDDIDFNNINYNSLKVSELNYMLGLLFSGITSQAPRILDTTYDNANKLIDSMYDNAVYYVILFAIIIYIFFAFSQAYDSIFDFPRDFAFPIMSSIPPAAISTFHQVMGTSESEEEADRDDSERVIKQLFQEESTFASLLDSVLLLSSDNKIVSATPEVITTFELDSFDFVGMELIEFVNTIAKSFEEVLDLPPSTPQQFDFMRKNAEGEDVLFLGTLTPIHKFTVKGISVTYVCQLEDVTRLNMLISQMNYEANHVRLLTAQVISQPAFVSYLDGSEFQPLMFSKIVIGTFYISATSLNSDLLYKLIDIVRSALNRYKSISFFGRTIQAFRVVTGITDIIQSPTECATDIVNFAMLIFKQMKQIEKEYQVKMANKCGIHLSGPFIGDLVSDMPPIFDLLGATMATSVQIAAAAPFDHICITRDVYEAIFDQGFNITFDNEIPQIGGEAMSIHNVEYL